MPKTYDSNFETGIQILQKKPTDLDKFCYLQHLRATNVHLFYRLLIDHVKVNFLSPPCLKSISI
jgi:malate dehydrogenase (oxaloacetate-decarboxylating)(NADP+)